VTQTSGVVKVLHPGDVAVARSGDRLETLLGSCVAVVLTDVRRSVGVMCHIVHAGVSSRQRAGDTAFSCQAIDRMYAYLLEHAFQPRQCEAYVYGGGNMFPRLFRSDAAGHVGTRNIDAVLARLAADGVRILHKDVGGTAYRRLGWTVGAGAPQVTAVEV
jgi:chemotaxis protein CheD